VCARIAGRKLLHLFGDIAGEGSSRRDRGQARQFRADLYYRLNVIRFLSLPCGSIRMTFPD
jgi:hypothetical protein